MIGKKALLAKLIFSTHLYRVMLPMHRVLIDDLKILAYHRICDTDNINDPELVSASVESFTWQVELIKQKFFPLTFDTVIRCLEKGRKLPRKAIIITFDDGFLDNYVNAYRILRDFDVPATFFISTGYIGTKKNYWFNLVCQRIMSNPGKPFRLGLDGYIIPDDHDGRYKLVEQILALCKSVPNMHRLRILDDLESQLELSTAPDPLSLPMSWDNVREMSRNGMEFGSHSVSHPILTQLSPAELQVELEASKRKIETETGKPVRVIAYPDGQLDSVNASVIEALKKNGYTLGACYIGGNNHKPKLNQYFLRRVHVERDTCKAMFASMLALPELFA